MAKHISDTTIKSLAARLSDPEAMRQVCDDAGRQLLDAVRNQPFDRMRMVLAALSYGVPFFKGLNRKPSRSGDIVFTDYALAKRVEIYRTAGERMEKLADRSTTKAERDDVQDLLSQPDTADLYGNAVVQFRTLDLDGMLEFVESISDPDGINQIEDDLMDAQDVKLDLMLFILSQVFIAASERLKAFTSYRLPDP